MARRGRRGYDRVVRRTEKLLLGAALALAVACGERGPRPGEPVRITAGRNGYEPWRVRAVKDVPLTLVVTRTTDETCARPSRPRCAP